MGFEETVEERHVVEPECDGNLFDRQCGDFQLCLGIGEYGVNDDVACRAVSPDRENRFSSIGDFHAAWENAVNR